MDSMSISRDDQKKNAAKVAVDYVENNMIVGLGTGSTAEHAITFLAERVKNGLKIKGVPSSKSTEAYARKLGIPMLEDFNSARVVDVNIDGADEADRAGHLIKGGGGALTREKIIATMARRVIIIADESKLKETIGAFPLPVEVLPFGWNAAAESLKKLGATSAKLREHRQNVPFQTDNGNAIIDAAFEEITDPESLTVAINRIPAVLENGLFCNVCDHLIFGQENGEILTIDPPRRTA